MKKFSRRKAMSLALGSAGLLVIQGCDPGKKNDMDESSAADTDSKGNLAGPDLNEAMKREDILALLDQRVRSIMEKSHHCAQTSFLALKEQFELEDGAILRALTPMPGLGEKGGTCGAVTGCMMCLGLVFGRDRLDDWEAYRASIRPAGEFVDRFREIRNTLDCKKIVALEFGKEYDLSDPEEQAAFARQGATEKCTRVVQDAVRIAADIILREKYQK